MKSNLEINIKYEIFCIGSQNILKQININIIYISKQSHSFYVLVIKLIFR